MRLTITNRSSWPDWFVRPVCGWIVRRAKIKHDYTILLPGYADRSGYAGRGGRSHQRTRINRRYAPHDGYPYADAYRRYKWAAKFSVNCRIESFVLLVAHEAAHATIAHPSLFRGATNLADMECAAQRFAHETVAAFRREWPRALRQRVVAAARKHRETTKTAREQRPNLKLVRAEASFRRWQTKAKLAATKLKKYRRQIKYYEGRVAARGNP